MRASTIDEDRCTGGPVHTSGLRADSPPASDAAESAIKRTGFEIIAAMLITRVLDGRISSAQCTELLAMAA